MIKWLKKDSNPDLTPNPTSAPNKPVGTSKSHPQGGDLWKLTVHKAATAKNAASAPEFISPISLQDGESYSSEYIHSGGWVFDFGFQKVT